MDDVTLRPGDRLPFCYGMDEAQRYWSFEDQAGATGVLVLAGAASPFQVAEALAALAGVSAELEVSGAVLRVLASAGAPGWATAAAPSGGSLAHVMDNALFAAAQAPAVIVCDRAMRLVARFDLAAVSTHPQIVVEAARRLRPEPARVIGATAPVLIVPGVLDADACRRLIARFESGEHVEGAMASVDADGAPVRRVDAAKKHRRDLELDPAEPLHAEVVAALSARLVPEIAKAYQVQVAHLDRLLIARYDETGGYFRRHRDNSSPHLAFREFAVSLNLNTGEYDGGELAFPEFDDHLYAPPAGAAGVFSASLLHEARPIARGVRYVLLSFLHSDSAEARRQASLAVRSPEPA